MSIGPSHNYYEGRALADITPWVEYFIKRTSSQLCKRWAEEEFLEVVGTSNKNRAYRLACRYVELIRPK